MVICLVIGGLCLLYYIVTLMAAGFSVFSLIWVAAAAFFGGCGLYRQGFLKKYFILPVPVKWLMYGLFFAVAVLFVVIEGMIIKTALATPKKDADYVIVLGAQVRGEKPSQILYLRVMKAVSYLQENPDTKVIVSGGQGSGEQITEAECMRRLLVEKGVDSSKIIMEDKSVNTLENLKNSMAIVGKEHSFVIATCSFHQYRAQNMAKKLGAMEVSGTASRSNLPLLLNYYVREFFAVLRYLF